MTCRSVTGGDVAAMRAALNGEINVTYGGRRSALGGGPVYILRFGSGRGNAHYGAPLDGNVGMVGR